MTVFDISTDLRCAEVYPGDPTPRITAEQSLKKGDGCNLSSLFTCMHTGTHIDAPLHFVQDGISLDEMDLTAFMGDCRVIACNGMDNLTGADIEQLVPEGTQRVLIKGLGKCRLTRSAAFALVAAGVRLVGIDANSIADADETTEVHRELLLAGVAILEGLTLRHVQSGAYTLMALPIKISGVEAAPCRAVLLKA